jgi:hypothetical protein
MLEAEWSLKDFVAEYEELSRWLAQVYGAIYGNEQKLAPKFVRKVRDS